VLFGFNFDVPARMDNGYSMQTSKATDGYAALLLAIVSALSSLACSVPISYLPQPQLELKSNNSKLNTA
jgi:hypothetical protein